MIITQKHDNRLCAWQSGLGCVCMARLTWMCLHIGLDVSIIAIRSLPAYQVAHPHRTPCNCMHFSSYHKCISQVTTQMQSRFRRSCNSFQVSVFQTISFHVFDLEQCGLQQVIPVHAQTFFMIQATTGASCFPGMAYHQLVRLV